jgi:hypothetical protein
VGLSLLFFSKSSRGISAPKKGKREKGKAQDVRKERGETK